jgi:hypothetical protein
MLDINNQPLKSEMRYNWKFPQFGQRWNSVLEIQQNPERWQLWHAYSIDIQPTGLMIIMCLKTTDSQWP